MPDNRIMNLMYKPVYGNVSILTNKRVH